MIRKDAERGGESGFAIYVNGSHPRVRRRFSIAHEIAHFALHRNLIGDGVTDDAMYRSNLSSAVEVQANRMAADIDRKSTRMNSSHHCAYHMTLSACTNTL